MTPMMKCGCAGAAKRQVGDGWVPACIVHDCIEQVPAPDLTGRTAHCTYGPHAFKPSSPDLAFFEYRGPGSREATDKCKCGYHRQAHHPRWKAYIKIVRRWYKHERHEYTHTAETHQPDQQTAEAWAAKEAERWRGMTRDENTRVFDADLIKVEQVKSPLKCSEFQARGPQEHDHYYCGCFGWD